MNSITGMRVIDSEWTAKRDGGAELTLHVAHPETNERVRLSFDLDQQEVLRMIQAYHGRHIFSAF